MAQRMVTTTDLRLIDIIIKEMNERYGPALKSNWGIVVIDQTFVFVEHKRNMILCKNEHSEGINVEFFDWIRGFYSGVKFMCER